MNLTKTPVVTQWPAMHYVFVEKIGPFQDTARQAWEELHQRISMIAEQCQIFGFTSLYKIEPQMIYRAGVQVDHPPKLLPLGFQYIQFDGGKYSKFVLTGSYSHLPEACGQVFEIVQKTKIPLEQNFFIENYVNDPKTTPEDQLVTEILIPTK